MRWNLAWLLVLFLVVPTARVCAAPPQSRYAGKPIPSAADETSADASTHGDDAGAATDESAKDATGGLMSVIRTGAALAFVVTLVLLMAWGYRKVSGNRVTGGPAAATVLARSSVSPRAGVVLLKVGRRVLVCGESTGHPLATLSEITDADEVAEIEGRLTGKRLEPQKPFMMSMSTAGEAYEDSDYPDPADSEVAAALQQTEEADAVSAVDETKGELAGLMDRVRTISRQLRTTQHGA